jgi:hypothetical protein
MFARLPDFGDAFALRVILRDIEPAIWQNSHLHDFEVGDIRFGMVDVEDELFAVDEHAAPLGAVAREGSRFTYRYDFGDDWEHDVVVESVIANGAQGIACSGGARACPPEDGGGPHGYANMLHVLANPADDEFASMKEWVGRRFDPERFDIAMPATRSRFCACRSATRSSTVRRCVSRASDMR